MKRLLFAASWMLAIVVFGTATPTTLAVPTHHPACHKHYQLAPGIRYARRIYAGLRITQVREMKRLGVIERCQYTKRDSHRLHHRAWHLRQAHRHRRGHQANTATWNHSVVSWYDDSTGQTASGVHDYYGVADCGTDGVCYSFGTKIEFCYHGCVTATVDDHGPYIAGRDYDLNQNTAQAIGALGVETVAWRLN